MMP
ncbi:hypothetical protein YPPY101_2786, partial [Yersinia pestis PY-101]|jgi:hypothetical protein